MSKLLHNFLKRETKAICRNYTIFLKRETKAIAWIDIHWPCLQCHYTLTYTHRALHYSLLLTSCRLTLRSPLFTKAHYGRADALRRWIKYSGASHAYTWLQAFRHHKFVVLLEYRDEQNDVKIIMTQFYLKCFSLFWQRIVIFK